MDDAKVTAAELKKALAEHGWPRNFHGPEPGEDDPCVGGKFPDV